MTSRVILKVEGDEATYLVDLGAKTIDRVEAGLELNAEAGQLIRGVTVAVATEPRAATSTFPMFSD